MPNNANPSDLVALPIQSVRPQRTIEILVDGLESEHARALFLISALHMAGTALCPARIMILGASEVVSLAAEAFAWDTGVSVTCLAGIPYETPLPPADLFLSASSWEPNWPFLAAAYQAGAAAISAVQFPRLDIELSGQFPHILSAHDTTVLAERIVEQLTYLRA